MVEGVAGEEDHHDEQEEHGEENAEAEGQHDEHDEDGMYNVPPAFTASMRKLCIKKKSIFGVTSDNDLGDLHD